MAKKVLNVFKKIGKMYVNGMVLYYKPLIDAKVTPFM